MKNSNLLETQLWLKGIITNPRGASAVLAELPEEHSLIQETPPLTSGERLDIYAEAYFTRIHEALSIDFSITKTLLEDESFMRLVAKYLKIYPSKEFNLNNISRHFPAFIKTYTDNTFFHDLAYLERLAVLSFYTEEADDFPLAHLAGLKEEEWGKIIFNISPSVFLISSHWPLSELWAMKSEDLEREIELEENKDERYFLLYRENQEIKLLCISSEQYNVLSLIKEGASLDDVNPLFSDASKVNSYFNEWIRLKILSSFYFEE